MSDKKKDEDTKKDNTTEDEPERFVEFNVDVVVDIILALFLGLIINHTVNILSIHFSLSEASKVLLQLFLIIVVLYLIQRYSYWIDKQIPGDQWKEGFGIIFIPLFFSAQLNITNLIRKFAD